MDYSFLQKTLSTKTPTVPTLRTLLKDEPKIRLAKRYNLRAVWFPNKYPNLSMETDKFRVNVYPQHAEFEELMKFFIEDCIPMGAVVFLHPDREGNYTISIDEKETCTWEPMGDKGLKAKDFKAKSK